LGFGVGIAVIAGQFNRCYRPPELVVVFGVEQGNRAIGEADVQ